MAKSKLILPIMVVVALVAAAVVIIVQKQNPPAPTLQPTAIPEAKAPPPFAGTDKIASGEAAPPTPAPPPRSGPREPPPAAARAIAAILAAPKIAPPPEAARATAVKVNITLAQNLAAPAAGSGIPVEALRAGVEPGGRVTDSKTHGSFSNFVGGHINAIEVTWVDPKLFANPGDSVAWLRRLLGSTNGDTWTFQIWSQMLGAPSVTATVQHSDGQPGQLLVWYQWPSIYFVYRDGAGTWWFGSWFRVEDLKL